MGLSERLCDVLHFFQSLHSSPPNQSKPKFDFDCFTEAGYVLETLVVISLVICPSKLLKMNQKW